MRCLLEGPPLGPGGEDITWPDQVAPRGRKASGTRKIKPQTSNILQGHLQLLPVPVLLRSQLRHVSLRFRLVIQDPRDVLL